MDLRIFTEPQEGAGYRDLLRVARCAEDAGFDGFFRSDHYLRMGPGAGPPGITDAWTTLAALAQVTSRIRLGTLMTAATFRLPGPLAITVTQVDEMSGGRVEFGVGTGWFQAEHTAFGIPFPSLRERFDRLAEQLEVITGLWGTPPGGTFDYRGRYYQLTGAPGLPPSPQGRIPVLIGGMGQRRTPALAARFATEFNLPFPPGMVAASAQFTRLEAACAKAGRDPAELVRSVTLVVCVGRDDAEVRRRAAAIGRRVEELREVGLAGTPAAVVERIERWRASTGVTRVYLQVLDLADLDHVELIAEDVLPVV